MRCTWCGGRLWDPRLGIYRYELFSSADGLAFVCYGGCRRYDPASRAAVVSAGVRVLAGAGGRRG